jgi:DNA-directed RNA polymerase subunit RPC12/RpoP
MFDKPDQAQPSEVMVAGKPLHCPICSHRTFHHENYVMSSRIKAIFDVEWAGRKVDAYACENCGHIMLFRPKPQ